MKALAVFLAAAVLCAAPTAAQTTGSATGERQRMLDLAAAELAAGRRGEAARLYAQAADRFQSVRALLQLARLQAGGGDRSAAIQTLQRASTLAPSSEDVLSGFAQLSLAAGAVTPAAVALQSLTRMCPTVAQYHYLLGVSLMLAGDMVAAYESLGPDHDGTCQAIAAWHIDKGTIVGVDVSGRTFTLLANIPGNILKGNWRVLAIVDDRSTPQQEEAILSVWTGKRGGPVANLAQLVGEVVGVERLPVIFTVEGGKGRIKIGQMAEAEMAPLMGPHGQPTTLNQSVFSTIPGSPAYVSQASMYKSKVPVLGINVDLHDHNAVQGNFRFVA